MKNVLHKLIAGSAEFVVMHAVLQQQRGRKASMSYMGEQNPRKALLTAQAELRMYTSLLPFRTYLKNLREGTVHYQGMMERITRQINMGTFTLAGIGTSKKEFKRLRAKNVRFAAMHWLNALRCGTTEQKKTLRFLREDIRHGHLTLEDIGTDEGELAILSTDISFEHQNVAMA